MSLSACSHISICLSVSLPVCPSLSMFVPRYLPFSLCPSLPACLSPICLSLSVPLCLPVFPLSGFLSLPFSTWMSLLSCVFNVLCLFPICPSLSVSLCPSLPILSPLSLCVSKPYIHLSKSDLPLHNLGCESEHGITSNVPLRHGASQAVELKNLAESAAVTHTVRRKQRQTTQQQALHITYAFPSFIIQCRGEIRF